VWRVVSSTGARTPTTSSTGAQNSSSAALERSTAALDTTTQGAGSAAVKTAISRPSATTPNASAHPGVRIPNRRQPGTTTPAAGATTTATTGLGGATAAAANGPTRIPLSQRRDPPPKLSLTLDLSVTNPRAGNTSKYIDQSGVPLATALRRRDAVVPDSSYGIAASSGVVRPFIESFTVNV